MVIYNWQRIPNPPILQKLPYIAFPLPPTASVFYTERLQVY